MAFLLFACEDGHHRQGLGYPTPRMSSAGFAVSPFISLRGTPQPSALANVLARKVRSPFISAKEIAGAYRSEIKEETAKPAGDIRGGAHPLSLWSGTRNKRRQVWAS